MRTRTVRTGTFVVMLATAGFALAACGSDDSNASGSSSASSASASSSSASSSGSSGTSSPSAANGVTAESATAGGGSGSSGGSGGSGSGSGGSDATAAGGGSVATCATGHLKVTTAGFSAGAGTAGFQIVFQNTGSAPCSLFGYPGVSFVKSNESQLGKAAARTTGTPVTRVTLIPNAHAYADVQTVNGVGGYSPAKCDLTNVPELRVYPPNRKASANIPWARQECVGSSIQNLRVGPVHGNK